MATDADREPGASAWRSGVHGDYRLWTTRYRLADRSVQPPVWPRVCPDCEDCRLGRGKWMRTNGPLRASAEELLSVWWRGLIRHRTFGPLVPLAVRKQSLAEPGVLSPGASRGYLAPTDSAQHDIGPHRTASATGKFGLARHTHRGELHLTNFVACKVYRRQTHVEVTSRPSIDHPGVILVRMDHRDRAAIRLGGCPARKSFGRLHPWPSISVRTSRPSESCSS